MATPDDPTADALAAAAEAGSVYDPATDQGDPLSKIVGSLYSSDPTKAAKQYEAEQTDVAAPENPRQADHASDIGGIAGKIVRLAQSFQGTPYVWGGSTPSGFDCSGFVQYVFRKVGVDLPRVSFQQANSGQRVALNKAQAGDLVAWDNSPRNNGADHIAIYLGGGLIAEAPRPGVPLRIRKLGSNEGAWAVRVL